MDSSKMTTALLLISMFVFSTANPTLDCGTCGGTTPKTPKGPITLPPVTVPPVTVPPVTVPPVVRLPPIITLPPVTVPPVTVPPVTVPPVVTLPPVITLPPGIVPPVTIPPVIVPPVVRLPPVTIPPVTVPPVLNPPKQGKACPTPARTAPTNCPIDTLKLGACLDLIGGLVHIGLGDPAVNECCPVLAGLAELEAAACLCTTIKLNLLNLNIYLPIALQLLVTCGKTPPPGYTCPL